MNRRTRKGDRFLARYASEGVELMLEDPAIQQLVRDCRAKVPGTADKTNAEVIDLYARYLARRAPGAKS